MRAFITGACGFAGGYLGKHLVAQGHEVCGGVLWDPIPDKMRKHLGFPVETCNISRASHCAESLKRFEPDVVYHLAGISFVPEAASDFRRTLEINVGGAYSVFQAAAALDRPVKVVLVSSGEVYGSVSSEDLPITEATETNPKNPYSLSKIMAEEALLYVARTSEIRPYIVRPFNHIGAGQSESFVTASFASQLAKIAAGKSEPVLRVGNLEAKRDFMDVRDVVRAYEQIVQVPSCTVNLSSGNAISIQHILDLLIDISKLQVRIEEDPERMRPSETPVVEGSYEYAEQLFGWKPEIPLRTSLEDIYSYWLSRHSSSK